MNHKKQVAGCKRKAQDKCMGVEKAKDILNLELFSFVDCWGTKMVTSH